MVQADLEAPEADMYVVNINGEPWWEAIVSGIVLRNRSGIRLQAAKAEVERRLSRER